MRRTEVLSAGILVAFGLVTMAVVIPTFVQRGGQLSDLSPAFMPYVAAAGLTLVMAIHLALRLMQRSADDAAPTPLPVSSWLYLGAIIVTFAAAYFVTDWFGYLIGGPIMVAGFMAMARARPLVITGTAVVFPIVIWLFMEKLLGYPLP